MQNLSSTRIKGSALLALLSITLTGCFLQPGKFQSELVLLDNDQFSFAYEGEIHAIGIAQIMQNQNSQRDFRAYCYGDISFRDESQTDATENATTDIDKSDEATSTQIDATSVNGSRECTSEEIAKQRAQFDERQERRRERDRKQAEAYSEIAGGIDLTNPEAERDLARVLSRQKGFETVVSKGDGLFEVKYSASGSLSHDFTFPLIEGVPNANAFVQIIQRDGDMVRINAPGFNAKLKGNPMLALMMTGGVISPSQRDEHWVTPPIEGTFTIVTSGEIRANNTDEGPTTAGNRQILSWAINSQTSAAPTALIAFPQ